MTIGVADLAAPRLPRRRWTTTFVPIACAALLHGAALLAIPRLVAGRPAFQQALKTAPATPAALEIQHLVFIARTPIGGAGGGGGGNRQAGPIRHAEGIGTDAMTLRVRKPRPELPPVPPSVETSIDVPAIALDAKSLASGVSEQVGLPGGGVSYGTSTGPGSGGGVGEGTGTGIGTGKGAGVGEGSGGGIGGGVYRPGGNVTAPRVIREVKPTYTDDALLKRIQGRVVLEVIVADTGRTTSIRVIRPLDPGGLDEQAVIAASAWEFAPGRLGGKPVHVAVIIEMDFTIR